MPSEIILDSADRAWLANNGYTIHRGSKYAFAYRYYKSFNLARLLLGVSDPKVFVDHIDGNRLNNTRSNLRLASNAQNQCNVGLQINNTSGFKGVSWAANKNKWVARISVAGRRIHLGHFSCKVEAARAFNSAAEKYHGEFARIS